MKQGTGLQPKSGTVVGAKQVIICVVGSGRGRETSSPDYC